MNNGVLPAVKTDGSRTFGRRMTIVATFAAAFAGVLCVAQLAAARDIVADVLLSTLQKNNPPKSPEAEQQFIDLIDRIAGISDEEIPEFPIATNQYGVAMIQRYLDSATFCDQARVDFATLGVEKISAVMTNAFIVALSEAGQKAPLGATPKDFEPTQEVILAHRTIKKMFECM